MRRQGIDIDSRVEERRATYGEEGLTPPEGVSEQEYLEEEVAMEFLGGIGEESPELLNKITAENPGLIRRFINTLKNLWGRLTGNQRLECAKSLSPAVLKLPAHDAYKRINS